MACGNKKVLNEMARISMDFAVMSSQLRLIQTNKEKIKSLFSVDINYQSSHGDYLWVYVTSHNKDNAEHAKIYITALCNQDKPHCINLSPKLYELLHNSTLIADIEKETLCAVSFSNSGELHLQGDDLNVATAISKLEFILSKYKDIQQNNEIPPQGSKKVKLSKTVDGHAKTTQEDENLYNVYYDTAIKNGYGDNEIRLVLDKADVNQIRISEVLHRLNDNRIEGIASDIRTAMTTYDADLSSTSVAATNTQSESGLMYNSQLADHQSCNEILILSDDEHSEYENLINQTSIFDGSLRHNDTNSGIIDGSYSNYTKNDCHFFAKTREKHDEQLTVQCSTNKKKSNSGQRSLFNKEKCSESAVLPLRDGNNEQDVEYLYNEFIAPSVIRAETRKAPNRFNDISLIDRSIPAVHLNHNEETQDHPEISIFSHQLKASPCDQPALSAAMHHFPRPVWFPAGSSQCQTSGLNSSIYTGTGMSSSKNDVTKAVTTAGTIVAPMTQPTSGRMLRYVVIDGSNVAFSHSKSKVFSCRGIRLCVDYFLNRGHLKNRITVFVPQWRLRRPTPDQRITDQHILTELESEKILSFTPSRRVGTRNIVCYDDQYMLRLAYHEDGIVVTNDNFRDLWKQSYEWDKIIEARLLPYTFVHDQFMPPNDPLGRNGPSLDDFLLTEA